MLAGEITWIVAFLVEIKFPVLRTLVLWCDNMSVGALATNPVFHAKTKHIEIDIHFVMDKVLAKEVSVGYVPMVELVAPTRLSGAIK